MQLALKTLHIQAFPVIICVHSTCIYGFKPL